MERKSGVKEYLVSEYKWSLTNCYIINPVRHEELKKSGRKECL